MQGRFIVFEGPDGAGKTTQLQLLSEWLTEEFDGSISHITTREPGGSPLAEKLRELLIDPQTQMDMRTEAMLVNTARSSHVHELIIPALRRGAWVLSDRFVDSTFAYQGQSDSLLDKTFLAEICAAGAHGIEPDLTFVLDVPTEVTLDRLQVRGQKDRIESRGVLFHQEVRRQFLRRAEGSPTHCIIDATQSVETIQHTVRDETLKRLLTRTEASA